MEQCKIYNINSRFIMVTLQRETSAISCSDESKFGKLTDYGNGQLDKIDWICCCAVPDNPADLNLNYRGFKNQIAGACGTYRHKLDEYKLGAVSLLYKEHEEAVICGSAITYAMLRYTPHLSVLNLNETLYKQYFGSYDA